MRETPARKHLEAALQEAEAAEGVSRREFLKTAGVGIVAALYAGNLAEAATAIEKAAETERLPGEPKIAVDIFYGMHRSAEDVRGLAERIRQADVFVPEAFGWQPEFYEGLQRVSRGEMYPDEFFYSLDPALGGEGSPEYPGFEIGLVSAIYESKKPLVIFDVPYKHPRLYERGNNVAGRVYMLDFSKPLPELLRDFEDNTRDFATFQIERENFMLAQLAELKKKITEGRIPELKGKKEAKVLMFLGAMHSRVYHTLSRAEEEVSRSLPVMPFVFGGYVDEAIRRHVFGKKVEDELALRGAMWIALRSAFIGKLYSVTPDTYKAFQFLNKLDASFSPEEIRKTLEELRAAGADYMSLRKVLGGRLAGKGLRIPESREEFEAAFFR